jgi:hypothetical protein
MDAQQIYDTFKTHAQGTQALAAAQQMVQELAAWYPDSAVSVQKLVNGIHGGWKGNAANLASQGLAPLAEHALASGEQLSTAQDLISRQVESFHRAASAVQPVPPPLTLTNIIAAAAGGQNPPPLLDQIAHRQAAQQSNVDVYNRYVGASQYNASNMPALSDTISTPSAPVAAAPPPPPAPPVSTPASNAPARHTATPTISGSQGYVPATGTSGRVSAAPNITGVATTGGTTVTSAAMPAAPQPVMPGPAPVGSGPGTGTVGATVNPVPVEPIVPISGMPTGAGVWPPASGDGGFASGGRGYPPPEGAPAAGGRSGPGVPPGEGNGTGVGPRGGVGAVGEALGEPGMAVPRSGAGPSVVGGPAGGLPGEGENPGARSGAVAGVAAEEEAMAAEGGITARPGQAGMTGPIMGGHGGRGGEDDEHKRRYGVDEDGDERFGTDKKTVPPVIGESAAEREQRYADDADRHKRDR